MPRMCRRTEPVAKAVPMTAISTDIDNQISISVQNCYFCFRQQSLMQPFNVKRLLPHLYIVLGFALISLVFCYPAMEGQVLRQHDVVSWQAMYHETISYYDSTGVVPLWTNSMFGGMPTYTIGIPETNNYVHYIQLFFETVLVSPAHYLFLAMFCFYILMLTMRVNRLLGGVGALAYAFATYNLVILNAGHQTKMLSIAYLPAVLAGLIMIYQGRRMGGAAILGLSVALFVTANHFQVIYYALILIAFFVIANFIIALKKKQLKDFFISSAVALVMGLLAVGPSMMSILPTQEYSKVTMRGGESELTINKTEDKKAGGLDKDYAFRWSTGIMETFCIMIPYLYGGSVAEPIEKAPETEMLVGNQVDRIPLYWGPQAETGIFSGPVYFGAIICFLFVLGLFVIRSPHKWWIVVLCLFTIMMSWGKYLPSFNYWLFDNLPMLNKFRSPSTVLIIPQLLFPMLGIWAVMEIIKGKVSGEELRKHIKLSAGITGGLCLLLGVAGGMFFDYTHPQFDAQLPPQIIETLKDDRAALAMKSALTSAVYIALSAALLWFFSKDSIKQNFLIGGLALLVAIDLMPVASNYLNESNYEDPYTYEAIFQPRPVDQQILQDPDPYYRVLDLSRNTYNDAIQAYFHKSIGGYSPAKMEIYQDLIDVHMGGAIAQGRFNSEVLNMLNTKYIIFEGPQQQPVYQQNPEALGNAWFVEEVQWVSTADEEIMALKAPAVGDTTRMEQAFDAERTAVVRNTFQKELEGFTVGKDSAAEIQLTKYGLNELHYQANNSQNGLAVFSDIWYPHGWKAFVDGEETPIIRANYVLRAIKVPAGAHKIEFRFEPATFKTGNTIAGVSSVILLLFAVFALVVILRKKKEGIK